MPFTLTMPKLSPTMEEGTIAKWHKKVGDHVEAGDLLFEVATDKATVEYNALDSGWLRKILLQDGGEALVNQPVAIFTEEKNESIEGYKPEGVAPKEAKAAPQPAKAGEEEGKAAAEPARQSVAAAPAGVMRQPAFTPEAPLANYKLDYDEDMGAGRRKISPLARKLAREKGLDLSTVKGTGPWQSHRQ